MNRAARFIKSIVTIYDSPCMTKKTERGIESTISDEGLYGMTCEVIGEECCFYKVRTHYRYEGYVKKDDICFIDSSESFFGYEKKWIMSSHVDILSICSVQGDAIISLTRGAIVYARRGNDSYAEIKLYDGSTGYVKYGHLSDYVEPMSVAELKEKIASGLITEEEFRERLVSTAKRYLGTSYRWGGKSPLGIDCSGMTSMSYMLNGILTYRDAKIVEGYPVLEIKKEDLKKGDLIYFPGHIAMYMGNDEYIHSTAKDGSDGVVINSLDPKSPLYREDLPEKIKAYGSIF